MYVGGVTIQHTEINNLDLSLYICGTIYVTKLVLMCLFPRLRNLSNVSFYIEKFSFKL